jgi:hypothetical protein
MKLHQLSIGLMLTIATAIGTQSAAWSFILNNQDHTASVSGKQLALQPTTSGEPDSQGLDTPSQVNSDPQQSAPLQQPDARAESSAPASPNVSKYHSINCQFIPQTSGGTVLKQLDALSKCNSGN